VHHAAHSTGQPTAVFDTTAGTLRCTLFEKETPITVKNFIDLANGTRDWTNPVSHATKHNTPLYDGTIFHRIIPNFMIQGGDPAGNGSGDPGYKFKDEIVPTLMFDRPGRLAMANSGPGTNGSQFFITEVPTPHLNGKHTIFPPDQDQAPQHRPRQRSGVSEAGRNHDEEAGKRAAEGAAYFQLAMLTGTAAHSASSGQAPGCAPGGAKRSLQAVPHTTKD
jgi:cyclophilin family peptidyl-prolyl cis-trans isomerase